MNRKISELMLEIKEGMKKSALVKRYVYFTVISGSLMLILGMFLLFLMFGSSRPDLSIWSLLFIVFSIFIILTILYILEFIFFRKAWILYGFWNFIDGVKLKYNIIADAIFAIVFLPLAALLVYFTVPSIFYAALIFLILAFVIIVIRIIFRIKRYKEIKGTT